MSSIKATSSDSPSNLGQGDDIDDDDVPQEFFCPILYSIMKDPVLMPDGQTYEREAIRKALSIKPISPVTRQPMDMKDARTNYALKSLIENYLQNRRLTAEKKHTTKNSPKKESANHKNSLEQNLNGLVDMGFDLESSKEALKQTKNNFDLALELLLNELHCLNEEEEIQVQPIRRTSKTKKRKIDNKSNFKTPTRARSTYDDFPRRIHDYDGFYRLTERDSNVKYIIYYLLASLAAVAVIFAFIYLLVYSPSSVKDDAAKIIIFIKEKVQLLFLFMMDFIVFLFKSIKDLVIFIFSVLKPIIIGTFQFIGKSCIYLYSILKSAFINACFFIREKSPYVYSAVKSVIIGTYQVIRKSCICLYSILKSVIINTFYFIKEKVARLYSFARKKLRNSDGHISNLFPRAKHFIIRLFEFNVRIVVCLFNWIKETFSYFLWDENCKLRKYAKLCIEKVIKLIPCLFEKITVIFNYFMLCIFRITFTLLDSIEELLSLTI